MKRPVLVQLLSAVLLALFLYAGLSKLLNYPEFVSQLEMHPLLKPVARVMACSLPAVELEVSVFLFIPMLRRGGLYLSLMLLIVFSVYILGMLLTASHLPCSCGGVFRYLSWREHLYCNIVFALMAWWAIRLERADSKSRNWQQNFNQNKDISYDNTII